MVEVRWRREATTHRQNADEWERNAALCVKAGGDVLAREALQRRREAQKRAAQVEGELTRIGALCNELERGLAELEPSPAPE